MTIKVLHQSHFPSAAKLIPESDDSDPLIHAVCYSAVQNFILGLFGAALSDSVLKYVGSVGLS
jgi:hypothetical protein